jgi:hypothetical protein
MCLECSRCFFNNQVYVFAQVACVMVVANASGYESVLLFMSLLLMMCIHS